MEKSSRRDAETSTRDARAPHSPTPRKSRSTSRSASSPTTSAPLASPSPMASSPATPTATTSSAASCAAPCATAAPSASPSPFSTSSPPSSPTKWVCLPRNPRQAETRRGSAPPRGRGSVEETIKLVGEAKRANLDDQSARMFADMVRRGKHWNNYQLAGVWLPKTRDPVETDPASGDRVVLAPRGAAQAGSAARGAG